MKTKRLLLCTLIAGILTVIFGGSALATAGNTAEISGGKTWNICVDAGASYAGSDFVVNVAKTDFASQIVLGNGDCKSVEMAAGTYTASLSSTMGVGTVSYEIANDTLTFSVANSLRKYLNTFGSIAYTVEGSGEESPFELLFSMPGECQFNGNANVSGDTCKDGDGNPLTNKKYIDTNVALFSEENAGKDFEIYFTLSDYASTQEKQGTLFNAKYENSSMYYPGFTIRTVNTDGGAMEITGRLGKDNTNADKANNSIVTADIKNKEVKIVRVGGMVSYSIDGGEMIPFQNYKNFSRYFEQTAVFGASRQTNGNPQRYYDGTIKNIRVYLKKVPVETTGSIEFQANGGTGSMATIEGIEVGTDVVLPISTLSMNNANFTGWNTKSNGTGTAYADGATITISEAGKLKLYAQWEGTGIAVLDEGRTVNRKMKSLANARTVMASSTEDTKIKAIRAADGLPDGFDATKSDNIVSDDNISSLPIYTWFDNKDNDGDGKGDGIIYVYTIATGIYGGVDMGSMFAYEKSLNDISALADWDISGVTNMEGLFRESGSLSDISPLIGWDTSNVTDMGGVFRNVTALSDISPLAGWNISNVADLSYIFSSNSSLSDISILAGWDTSNVTNMESVFGGDSAISDISSIAGWNTSKVTNMDHMFNGVNITDVDALETKKYDGNDYASWDVSSVTNLGNTFSNISNLTDISVLASWNTSNVVSMEGLFSNDRSLANISALASWDTSSLANMSRMFYENSSLSDLSPLATWNTSSLTNMYYTFCGIAMTNVNALRTKQYDGKDYVSWDVSHVTNMSLTFYRDHSLTDISALASWNTSNVKDMGGMFDYSYKITDISALASWDTSSVTDMSNMFDDVHYLTDISPLATWNTSSVKDISDMFRYTSVTSVDALETKQHAGKDYISWDTSSVTDMSGLFYFATSLTNISALSSWDTSNVKNMSEMFWGANLLSDISPLAYWNTSKVTNMGYMFMSTAITNVDALETKQHEGKDYISWDISSVRRINKMFDNSASLMDISALASWDTSNVTDMDGVFFGAAALADISPLAYWNTSKVTDMDDMFKDTIIINVDALETKQHEGKDYVSWDTSKVTSMSGMFYRALTLTDVSALSSWNTSSVTNMSEMFFCTRALTDVSALSSWNTSSVTNMSDMFRSSSADPLPSWYH